MPLLIISGQFCSRSTSYSEPKESADSKQQINSDQESLRRKLNSKPAGGEATLNHPGRQTRESALKLSILPRTATAGGEFNVPTPFCPSSVVIAGIVL